MKTIASLLEAGRAVLHRQAVERCQEEEKEENRRRQEWQRLREKALADLGELAQSLPEDMPDGFHLWQREITLRFCPFGGTTLQTQYALHSDGWVQVGVYHEYGGRTKLYRVESRFHVVWDDDGGDDPPFWHVRTTDWHETDDLAEAVAVCSKTSQEARELRKEADARPAPQRNTPTKQPLALSDAEERLILALRDLLPGE